MPTLTGLRRFVQQRLVGSSFTQPAEVVAWLGAVQAQDYPGALWSLGLRMSDATEDAINAAFDAGQFLRTHIMRPTWHFVTPEDIRWLMTLTAPRVRAISATHERRLDLDDALLAQTNTLIARALEGERYLTRSEIGAILAEAGIEASGQRLAYIMMRAELDLVVGSGPRRGKQFTYALLDERAPRGPELDRDAALVKLLQRYFSGHGPATLRDFAWWSGLTLTDARTHIDQVPGLEHTVIDDEDVYFSADTPAHPQPSTTACLLPGFDEFLLAFTPADRQRRGAPPTPSNGVYDLTIVIDGHVVGTWRRTLKAKAVIIELPPYEALPAAEYAAVVAAAARYGTFLGLPVQLEPAP